MSACIRDQRGAAVLWALLCAGLLLTAGATLLNRTETSAVAHTDVRQALETAVKAAAFRVTPQSQADGAPDLDPAAAHAAFREALAANLGLDPATLAPLAGSPLARLEYALAVQTRAGATVFAGGSGAAPSSCWTAGGLPAAFSLGAGAEVVRGTDPGRPVHLTLDMPGAVAAVAVEPLPLAGRKSTAAFRWAAAKVVMVP